MDQETGPSTSAKRFEGSKNHRDLRSVFITPRTSNWLDWIIEATSDRSWEVKRAVTKWISRRFARNAAHWGPRLLTMDRSASSPGAIPAGGIPTLKVLPSKVMEPRSEERRVGKECR